MASVWTILFHYLWIHTFISTKENQYSQFTRKLRSEWQSNFWLKQKAAKATFFCFIFRVRERIMGSVEAERNNRNLILLWRLLLFWKKCLILGNFDTPIRKICISRPLGTTPENGTWLLRQTVTGSEYTVLICQESDLGIQFWSVRSSLIGVYSFDLSGVVSSGSKVLMSIGWSGYRVLSCQE